MMLLRKQTAAQMWIRNGDTKHGGKREEGKLSMITCKDLAKQFHTGNTQISQARELLVEAPDLAAQVARRCRRRARKAGRTKAARVGWEPPYPSTVANPVTMLLRKQTAAQRAIAAARALPQFEEFAKQRTLDGAKKGGKDRVGATLSLNGRRACGLQLLVLLPEAPRLLERELHRRPGPSNY
jgi:hypothetical protein